MSDRTNRAARPGLGGACCRPAIIASSSSSACVIAMVCILVGGHLYGRYLASRDLAGRDNAIEQLRDPKSEAQRQLDDQSAQADRIAGKARQVQATLDAIMPSAEHLSTSSPINRSIVGDGHLTVGLVGSPSQRKRQAQYQRQAAVGGAGQVIDVAPDPRRNVRCGAVLRMFKAVLYASCTPAKPQ